MEMHLFGPRVPIEYAKMIDPECPHRARDLIPSEVSCNGNPSGGGYVQQTLILHNILTEDRLANTFSR